MTLSRRQFERTDLLTEPVMEYEGTPCILWTGATDTTGYGRKRVGAKFDMAHRAVYETEVGPIPKGFSIDHLCHTADAGCLGGRACPHRQCVNVLHLEPVSRRTNLLRGRGFPGENARKTHCPQGHPYDEANTYRDHGGHRHCRACARARAAARYGARRT